MKKTLNNIITNFQTTGDCTVDVDLVCEMWNHNWFLAQWHDESKNQYRLIKMVRLGTPNTRIKVQISIEQAKEIIDRLKLDGVNGGFGSATTWRQDEEYWAKLDEFNTKRR